MEYLLSLSTLIGGRVPVQTAANKSFDIYKPSQSYAEISIAMAMEIKMDG